MLGVATPIFSAEAPQKVRIAYASRSSSAMPQYMALQKGYFKAEGLEVEIIQMNPRLGATAVVNGDVSFATPFTSTFRGMLQGFPMKLVFIHLKKGPYYVMVRPDIKDVQQLKGKRIGVATIKGTDQLVAEEMLQAKGFNPNLLASGRHRRRASAHASAYQRRGGSDLRRAAARFNAQKNGLSGVGRPARSGLALGRYAHFRSSDQGKSAAGQANAQGAAAIAPYILENRQETIQTLIKWLPQPLDIAEHSYDGELKTLSKDGTMTDAEIEAIIARVGEKKRPLDEVRDFSFARQAMKEMEAGK